ncbi:MAG: sigma-70 family RNA polymerase sigma factor [bacterium]|nr:sigma-70 family RNA polymerase sigma factor [bacterium]
MAADGHDVVTQAMAERATASRPASALYREPARFPSEGIDDHYGRFQREIIPHLDAAYNFARFLSRDPDAAHDIVQETFLRAFRGFAGYQGGDPRAWIFSIVRNCYRNWLLEVRHKARLEADIHRHDDAKEFSIDDVAANEDTPEEALVRKSEAGVVRHVLGKLPRALREVLVLRELEGLSYRQIAESSALPIGTVMSRLARARTQFQNLWQQEKQT